MNEPKAARYQRMTRRARVVRLAAGAGLLAVLAFTPIARELANWALASGRWAPAFLVPAAATTVFVMAIVLLWELAALPVVLYLALHVERRFGRAEVNAGHVMLSHVRGIWIAAAAALAMSAVIALAIRVLGELWWLGAGALSTIALAAAVRMLPVLVPGMLESRPIARPSLMSGLREIARHSGVPISDIREWRVDEDARATAIVAGMGRTRRVFVASSILREWSDDEIAVVVAHELAHHVHQDLWRALALNAVVLSGAFWVAGEALVRWSGALGLTGRADLAALPLLALVAGGAWLLATPLRYAQSRAQERRADRFALALTREAAAFGAAVRRLSERHLVENQPSKLARWLFYRHPSVAERLAMAEQFAKAENLPATSSAR
jgi:STE24 endopeptidase